MSMNVMDAVCSILGLWCSAQTVKDKAAQGYKATGEAAKGASDYASDTAHSVKDTAADAASSVSAFIQKYLTWGESKAKHTQDITAKSIQVLYCAFSPLIATCILKHACSNKGSTNESSSQQTQWRRI